MTAATALIAFKAYALTMVGFMAGYLILLNSCWSRLQTRHPATWEVLGRPIIFNVAPSVVFGSRRFLLSADARSLCDDVLIRRARWAMRCAYSSGVMFLAFAALCLWLSLHDT
jgi:hypothetical protein